LAKGDIALLALLSYLAGGSTRRVVCPGGTFGTPFFSDGGFVLGSPLWPLRYL